MESAISAMYYEFPPFVGRKNKEKGRELAQNSSVDCIFYHCRMEWIGTIPVIYMKAAHDIVLVIRKLNSLRQTPRGIETLAEISGRETHGKIWAVSQNGIRTHSRRPVIERQRAICPRHCSLASYAIPVGIIPLLR
jgi:hypothetical protein